MKLSAAALAVLAALLVGAGYSARAWQDRPTVEQTVIRRSADSLQTAALDTDSSIARRRPVDGAAVAEPERAAGVHLQHAGSLGDSVTYLAALTDSAIAAAATSDSARARAEAALAAERATREQQAAELRAGAEQMAKALAAAKQIIRQDSVDMADMQRQRNRAQQLLAQALAVPRRHRCGPGATAGAGVTTRGLDGGLFIGATCLL